MIALRRLRAPSHWLKRYYGVRALVFAIWVALAFTLDKRTRDGVTAYLVAEIA